MTYYCMIITIILICYYDKITTPYNNIIINIRVSNIMMRAIYHIQAQSSGHIGRVGYARGSSWQVPQSIIIIM